jgi:hypothetical protein
MRNECEFQVEALDNINRKKLKMSGRAAILTSAIKTQKGNDNQYKYF